MEHFSVIQSIIRAGLSGDSGAFDKQVVRLRTRLEKAGATKEAATIERLLKAATETKDIKPSRVEVSRARISGEVLTPDTNPPIDRETGASLCQVHFPTGERNVPVYEGRVFETVAGLLEEWSSADALRNVGVEPTRSLLIFGPPGSGKTLTATYIAEQLGLPLVTAKIDGLISSFLGTTARNIANLFDFANRYSCVLLLDEFDALAKVRDDPQEVGEIKRVVNSLLQNLDHRRAFGVTIAITNHDRLLDPAVWRRFETHIHIGEPGTQARTKMIERFLAPLKPEPPIFSIIAYCLEGHSGADLERICVSLKRSLALSGESHDGPGLFHALSAVLSRLPSQDHAPARILASDPEAFISLIANDLDFPLKQAEIGQATGYGQSRVSDIKKSKRHLTLMEAARA
ncbi:MAG: AAA family ATPase [Rhodovulum sp.]|nr:AAA family ATPase [Rhodovulum sp.]|tara:strand:- start:2499 stop:3704 length:1206 start_codon:yes stop_codon:yes gene_type:complete